MTIRPDWAAIIGLVPAGTRVLELGCGDGSLMAQFMARKAIFVRGVARGLSVRHGDIENGLADFAEQAFEYVILSQTIAFLQRPMPVLREMLRVARFGIVSIQNAGYWQDRLRAFAGRVAGHPLDSGLPLSRSITVPQFHAVLRELGVAVERTIYLTGDRRVLWWPTLRARTLIFAVRSQSARKKDRPS